MWVSYAQYRWNKPDQSSLVVISAIRFFLQIPNAKRPWELIDALLERGLEFSFTPSRASLSGNSDYFPQVDLQKEDEQTKIHNSC